MTQPKSDRQFYFFIGTEAELIKFLPVLHEFEQRGIPYKIIASGQNDLIASEVFRLLQKKSPDIFLSEGTIKQTALGLFIWFFVTFFKALFMLHNVLPKNERTKRILFIHGDTVSTVMGAFLGRLFGMKIAHVEAGLRSFNYFHPFPEEIDRVIASRFVSYHFCPNNWAVSNLSKRKGEKINTKQNTLIESLHMVLHLKNKVQILEKMKGKKYFIFILHRQENLYNKTLVKALLSEIQKAAETMTCLFVMHKPTELVLKEMGLYNELKQNKNIIMTERLGYISFMKVLQSAEFILTDGGSNQEESYYFGKPCLILRDVSERKEGLGENVILSKNNMNIIHDFIQNHKTYQRKPIAVTIRPSTIIADTLIR